MTRADEAGGLGASGLLWSQWHATMCPSCHHALIDKTRISSAADGPHFYRLLLPTSLH